MDLLRLVRFWMWRLLMSKYTLKDYEELAYEFAIRNPKVIELLKSELTDDVAKELLNTYGISTKVEYQDSEGNLYEANTLEELYLDYSHLGDTVKYKGMHTYKDGKRYALAEYYKLFPYAKIDEHEGYKKIVHPGFMKVLYSKESPEGSIDRINKLFSKQGRGGGVITRLKSGAIFKRYDMSITMNNNQINQYESTIKFKADLNSDKKEVSGKEYNAKGAIKKDIALVKLWIKPTRYLQLVPQYIRLTRGMPLDDLDTF